MKKEILILSLLALTACDAGSGKDPNFTVPSGSAGTTTSPVTSSPSTEDKLQGSWKRVGQYCGTTYTTGLAEQHAAFTSTGMTISLKFVCDNQVHVAQHYDARYDHDTVQVEMTDAATGSCPMVYTSAGSPGRTTYTATVYDTDSPATLELEIGTCANGSVKKDVYQKE